jgi:hypothetical protein
LRRVALSRRGNVTPPLQIEIGRLGVVALEGDDVVRASALYRSSLQHAHELEDPDLFTDALGELALLAVQLDDPEAGAYVLGAHRGSPRSAGASAPTGEGAGSTLAGLEYWVRSGLVSQSVLTVVQR